MINTAIQLKKKRYQLHGFTLIEVMIAIAIVGILSAIAYPNYTEYIRKSHRSDARAGLLQAQLWMERAATAQGVYPTHDDPNKVLPASLSWSGENSKRYTISMSASTKNSFTLTATPKIGTPQEKDKCGTLTLTQTGVKEITSKPIGSTLTADECWQS